MDYITLIDWHCSGNTLTKTELILLDIEFDMRIKNIDNKSSLEPAPPHICKASHIDEGSLWISCFASVLDQLYPVGMGITRLKRLSQILDKFNLLKE